MICNVAMVNLIDMPRQFNLTLKFFLIDFHYLCRAHEETLVYIIPGYFQLPDLTCQGDREVVVQQPDDRRSA
jgi:hypothetical protein